jgi:hypothetical protein
VAKSNTPKPPSKPKQPNPRRRERIELFSILGALAAVLTIIVYLETIISWFKPEQPKAIPGLLIEHTPWLYHFPELYERSQEPNRKFFETAEGTWRLRITNISGLNKTDVRLMLPCESVLEIHRKSGVVQSPPGTSFLIGDLAKDEEVTIYVWFSRRLLIGEKLVILSSQTAPSEVPIQSPIDPAEIAALKDTTAMYRLVSIFLAVALAGVILHRRIWAWVVAFVRRNTA